MMFRPLFFLRVVSVLPAFLALVSQAQTIAVTGASIAGLRNGFVHGDPSALQLLSPTSMVQPQTFKSTMVIGEKPLRFPWKKDITTTVFWIGEAASGGNATPNVGSSWDPNWMWHYGGYDDPEPTRRGAGYRPAAFVPKLNPFYIALPYNDCYDNRSTKAEAARVVPWFKETFKKVGQSVCRNRWIAVRCGDKECYAQWSDCGPFTTEDAKYVFGDARPSNSGNNGAGLDVAPAVRDYLGLRSGGRCDWRFVELDEVPDGPWKTHGTNNPFSKDWKNGVEDESPAPVTSTTVAMTTQTSRQSSRKAPGIPGFKLKSTSR